MTTDFSILNVPRWYNGETHQQEALLWLWAQLTPQQQEGFISRWRLGTEDKPLKPSRISSKGLKLIREHEGLRLTAYRDPVGIWTIGWGHTRTAKQGMVITAVRAEELLLDDLVPCYDCINRYVSVNLNQNQFDALVSLIFNIGCTAFARSTLLNYLNSGSFGLEQQWKRWVYGSRTQPPLPGLVRRRNDEWQLFISDN